MSSRYKEMYNTTYGRLLLLVRSAAQRARKRGLPFDLDDAWVDANADRLLDDVCHWCGTSFSSVSLGHNVVNPYAPSLERLLPEGGYVKTNIVLAHSACNHAKYTQSFADWQARFHRLAARWPLPTKH